MNCRGSGEFKKSGRTSPALRKSGRKGGPAGGRPTGRSGSRKCFETFYRKPRRGGNSPAGPSEKRGRFACKTASGARLSPTSVRPRDFRLAVAFGSFVHTKEHTHTQSVIHKTQLPKYEESGAEVSLVLLPDFRLAVAFGSFVHTKEHAHAERVLLFLQ